MNASQRALLRRHRLAHISDAAWETVLARDWVPSTRACLLHWQQRRLPLVVTRQSVQDIQRATPVVGLGISAPLCMQRQRIQVQVGLDEILFFDEFPLLDDVVKALPVSLRPHLQPLLRGLSAIGCKARVYGSYGWQQITRQQHVHHTSDLDVWIGAVDQNQADAIVQLLSAVGEQAPRLDGELVFPGDVAVAWREWTRWRSGGCEGLLEKTLFGARLRGMALDRSLVEVAA